MFTWIRTAVLKTLSENSNIRVILALIFYYLFPYKLIFSWFFVYQVMLDCVLSIVSLRLGDTRPCLNLTGNVHIFVLPGSWVKGGNSPWPFVGCGFHLSLIFKAFEVLFGFLLCESHPAACLGPGGWSAGSVPKGFVRLFGIKNMRAQCERSQFIHNLVGFLSRANLLSLHNLLSTFYFPEVPFSGSPHQKAGLFVTLVSRSFPTSAPASGGREERKK